MQKRSVQILVLFVAVSLPWTQLHLAADMLEPSKAVPIPTEATIAPRAQPAEAHAANVSESSMADQQATGAAPFDTAVVAHGGFVPPPPPVMPNSQSPAGDEPVFKTNTRKNSALAVPPPPVMGSPLAATGTSSPDAKLLPLTPKEAPLFEDRPAIAASPVLCSRELEPVSLTSPRVSSSAKGGSPGTPRIADAGQPALRMWSDGVAPASAPTAPDATPPPSAPASTIEPDQISSADEDLFTGFPRDYKLGPGDRLQIIDPSMGTPERPLTAIVAVGPDGNIVVYPVGVIKAAGLTIPQLNSVINERAKEFEHHPRILVSLISERPITVYVLGDVVSPGLWNNGQIPAADQFIKDLQLTQRQPAQSLGGGSSQTFVPFGQTSLTMMAQPVTPPPQTTRTPTSVSFPIPSVLTAVTAIQLAGGVRETADIRHVTVRKRSSGKAISVDLWKLLAEGDFSQDVMLQSGDVVYVPTGGPPFRGERLGVAANQFRFVRIWGEVRMPGLYILGPNDDMFSIIARAGGFTSVADQKKVELSRVNKDGSITSRIVPVHAALSGADRIGHQQIMPGDVIVARASFAKKYGPSIAKSIAISAGAIGLLVLSREIVDQTALRTQTTTITRVGF